MQNAANFMRLDCCLHYHVRTSYFSQQLEWRLFLRSHKGLKAKAFPSPSCDSSKERFQRKLRYRILSPIHGGQDSIMMSCKTACQFCEKICRDINLNTCLILFKPQPLLFQAWILVVEGAKSKESVRNVGDKGREHLETHPPGHRHYVITQPFRHHLSVHTYYTVGMGDSICSRFDWCQSLG